MSVFRMKLGTLLDTVELSSLSDHSPLAARLRDGGGRSCLAIGSGGSIVSAAFLARCRGTLGLGSTTVATPMELILGDQDVRGADVWLFSAGASNPDIEAARRACAARGADRVTLVTTRADGRTAESLAAGAGNAVVVLPVADPKDGFLATHSLMTTVTALLHASNEVAGNGDAGALSQELTRQCSLALAPTSDFRHAVREFRPEDTLIVAHDPQTTSLALLIETSLWETGIAAVQRVDIRNFAHGRHVWLARHPDRTFLLAITARESREAWSGISTAIPDHVRKATLDLGNSGRLRNAVGVAAGLAIIDELGAIAGVDPGRPGRGDFAPRIYEHSGLVDIVEQLSPSVTHKRSAILRADPILDSGLCLFATGRARRNGLGSAEFGALALDYDGTIVATERRLDPPADALVAELVRLTDGGMLLGIATGRGGSAGEALRSALPTRLHERVLMGYYNGAHLLPLSTPLEESSPQADGDIEEVGAWLAGTRTAEGRRIKIGPVQLTIDVDRPQAGGLLTQLARRPAVMEGRLKVVSSQHSVDVVVASASKLRVVEALGRQGERPHLDVLAVGDSGSPLGNDHELLSSQTSISVDQVCGSPDGCWTLFGDGITGPDALHRILLAMSVESGRGRLDLRSLGLADSSR